MVWFCAAILVYFSNALDTPTDTVWPAVMAIVSLLVPVVMALTP
jgi:hypothetical protein